MILFCGWHPVRHDPLASGDHNSSFWVFKLQVPIILAPFWRNGMIKILDVIFRWKLTGLIWVFATTPVFILIHLFSGEMAKPVLERLILKVDWPLFVLSTVQVLVEPTFFKHPSNNAWAKFKLFVASPSDFERSSLEAANKVSLAAL